MGGVIVSIQDHLLHNRGKKTEIKKKSFSATVWHSRQEAKTSGRDTQTATQPSTSVNKQGTPKVVQTGRKKEDNIEL